MKVAFDATTLRPAKTGVGYYTEHLLRSLLLEFPEIEFSLLSNRPVETSSSFLDDTRTGSTTGLPFTMPWLQLSAPTVLRKLQPDVAHFTNSIAPLRRVVPFVLTVHDMSLWLLPRFHPLKRRLSTPLVLASIRRADAVITVSESARNDIVRLTGIPSGKVSVIYEAASAEFKKVSDPEKLNAIRRRYGLGEKVLLYVGTIEPRKNLPRLVRVFARLREQGIPHQLVLAGSSGWGYREVRKEIEATGADDHIVFTGYVPHEDLPGLYSLAESFIFPSYHEGFGLPVIEAMACGLPVAASSRSSMKEIFGGTIHPFDPHSEHSLYRALMDLVHDAGLRRELSERSLKAASQYSWARTARETVAVYRQVIEKQAG